MKCNCKKPYYMGVEPINRKNEVSHVDAYGQPLPGARMVTRCVHGNEMHWNGDSWVVIK